MRGFVIEVREPDAPPRRLSLDPGPVEVGRECSGLTVSDPGASRRHLRLEAGPEGLSVADLASTNGTFVNGARVADPVWLRAGDVVSLAQTTIVVVEAPERAEPSPVPPTGPSPAVAAAVRSALDDLAGRETEAAVIRYRPGSAGERAVAGVAAAAKRARRRLAGLGSEPWGLRPQLCLVDAFPDPGRPGQLITSGTLVDAERAEILDGRLRRVPARGPRAAHGAGVRRQPARRRRPDDPARGLGTARGRDGRP